MVARGGNTTGKVGKYATCTVVDRGGRFNIPGAHLLTVPDLDSAEVWLDYHGVEVKRGKAVLFKAVDDGFKSGYDFDYTPGTKPKCPDFKDHDGCGNGLHLCAAPSVSAGYFAGATKYLACTVKVSEIVVIDNSKVKVPAIHKIEECDFDGEVLTTQEATDA
jgi:hypothetical protein